jgi:glutamine cyclotransferase
VEGYQVVATYPHSTSAFTEGLTYVNGVLYESTGLTGASSLTEESLSGQAMNSVSLPSPYFGEGSTLFQGKLYWLTWVSQVGFIYDPTSMQQLGTFSYAGQGWGLTHDDTSLIMSNGTSQIQFLDPATFAVLRTINVMDGPNPIPNLNELEYVNGTLYANVWFSNRIACINPTTGTVMEWIDLTGLLPASETPSNSNGVLNGIAYDPDDNCLLVTGKLWPHLYAIQAVANT